jgi:D-glycero-D-manno-heptose 1,7-bisphosphate phosphatase
MTLKTDKSAEAWTLFLDRDGVINERIPNGYVLSRGQFVLLPGVTEALTALTTLFHRIIIVTNQQGIGKGLMTEEDLEDIHRYMQEQIHDAGGRIDAVYYCPSLEGTIPSCRKPAIDMGMAARRRFPEISFRRSVMVGDAPSDMLFGKRLGMKLVFVDNRDPSQQPGEAGCHLRVHSLDGLVKNFQDGHPSEWWGDMYHQEQL